MKLNQETVEKLFEEHTHQSEVLLALYRMAFPDWDRITSISGYPQLNDKTALHIVELFMAFDRKHHPNVLNGGAWMNQGFGSHGNVGDWEVDLSECAVEYIEVSENLVEIV